MTDSKFQIAYWVISLLILIVNVYFIATSAKNAVKIGRKLNNEQEKDNAKRNLFLLLFSLRGNQLHYDFVKGLNQIDVVFEDTPDVLNAWHIHSDSLNIKEQANAAQNWELQRTNLLSAMAVSLGYNRIRQTDMIKNYYPVGHEARVKQDYEFWEIQKRYYEKTTLMAQKMIDRMDEQDEAAKDAPTLPE